MKKIALLLLLICTFSAASAQEREQALQTAEEQLDDFLQLTNINIRNTQNNLAGLITHLLKTEHEEACSLSECSAQKQRLVSGPLEKAQQLRVPLNALRNIINLHNTHQITLSEYAHTAIKRCVDKLEKHAADLETYANKKEGSPLFMTDEEFVAKKEFLIAPLQAIARDIKATQRKFAVDVYWLTGHRDPNDLEKCSDPSLDLSDVPIGFQCATSKGAVFELLIHERLGAAWRDSDGLIWSKHATGSAVSHERAITTCTERGGRLPTRQEYDRGEDYGIREILSGMSGRVFWTSDIARDPDNPNSAYAYFSSVGSTTSHSLRMTAHTRCVSW